MVKPHEAWIDTSELRIRYQEAGAGPAVLFCHGFPESSHAWRHQLVALAQAGFRAIAPDLRGYGGTSRPAAVEAYSLDSLVGDAVALLDALSIKDCVIVGNDWGATIAWHAALTHPERFRGVVAAGVPLMPRPPVPPTTLFPRLKDQLFYLLYFQEPGVAEAELEQDVRLSLRKIYFSASGDVGPRDDARTPNPFGMVSRRSGMLASLPDPTELPAWLGEADLAAFQQSFEQSGFSGALNYYRNLDRNWQLQASQAGSSVSIPALFVFGGRDTGLQIPGMRDLIEAQHALVPQLRGIVEIPHAGHWVPQEAPSQFNAALLDFLRQL